MSDASPGSNRNVAISARCCSSGIKNLTLGTVVKGFAVSWELWLLLTFCCHASNLKTLLHISERFPNEPWMGMKAGRCFSSRNLCKLKLFFTAEFIVYDPTACDEQGEGSCLPYPVRLENLGNMAPPPKSTAGLMGDITSAFSVLQLLRISPS